MYLDFTQSAENLINDLFQDLERATVDRKHPYRFCYLATTQVDYVSTQRTVVLRRILPSKELLIFSDYRTPKVQEIKQQEQVSLLFYHPTQQIQIRLQAVVTIHHQDALCLREWSKLNERNKKDYQTILPPGSDLPKEELDQTHDPNLGSSFFSILSLKPLNMDILQLRPAGHQRMVCHYENREWIGRQVMP